MAGASLLALIDDIASVLDDVATLTKVAAKKTAGVLGDDLALNAQQVSGVNADRELPVVWAVARGSFINKAILVPAALAIGTFAPFLVTPLLMIGGAFLCYEGFEKLAHRWMHDPKEEAAERARRLEALSDPALDPRELERDKIKGAVRTDFILSAEIIAITLGTVSGQPFTSQLAVLTTVALLMTVGVYGLVAGIVKLDDAGLALSRSVSAAARGLGRVLLRAAPALMHFLSIAGTAAMFLVGGGILVHGVEWLHHTSDEIGTAAAAAASTGAAWLGATAGVLAPALFDAVVGIVAGALVLGAVLLVQRIRGAGKSGAVSAP